MNIVEQALALLPPQEDIETAIEALRPVNREDWLARVAEKFRERFEELSWPLPPPSKLAFAVGFPSRNARSTKKRRIGECWDSRCTPDGTQHILVSPIVADPIEAAGVLVHELVHAAIGGHHGHDKTFAKVVRSLGLEGKPTETTVGPELRDQLDAIIREVGPYPHQPLSFVDAEKKKSKNRQKKLTCPEHGDYIVRASKKVIESAPPLCGLCSTVMEADEEDDADEAADE